MKLLFDFLPIVLFFVTFKYAEGQKDWAAQFASDHFGFLVSGGIVGPNAGELIAELVLAIEMGADASDIGLTIHPHPTLSETVGLAAEAFEGTLTDLYIPKK